MLKPQDILIVTRLLLSQKQRAELTYPILSQLTGLSASEAHAATKRAAKVGLISRTLDSDTLAFPWLPSIPAIQEFLFHGMKFVFPLEKGAIERGVLTGADVPGVNQGDRAVQKGETWVWPYAHGSASGVAIAPLYRSAPLAAIADPELHRSLAALDLIRSSNHRLRKLGEDWWLNNLLRP